MVPLQEWCDENCNFFFVVCFTNIWVACGNCYRIVMVEVKINVDVNSILRWFIFYNKYKIFYFLHYQDLFNSVASLSVISHWFWFKKKNRRNGPTYKIEIVINEEEKTIQSDNIAVDIYWTKSSLTEWLFSYTIQSRKK